MATVTLAAVVVAGCGGEEPPGPVDEARVLLVGDSLAQELSEPFAHAVTAAGGAARFFLGPAAPRDPGSTAVWRSMVEANDADLVVLFLGNGEYLRFPRDGLTPDAMVSYRAEVVEPLIDLLTSRGAAVLWVGPPAFADAAATEGHRTLEAVYRAVDADRDDVAFVDADTWLSPAGFARTGPGVDGRSVQLRRADGIHLCPEGQLALIDGILPAVLGPLGLEADAAWLESWRALAPREPGGCAPGWSAS